MNRKTLAVPIVDGIEWNTLQHNTAYFGGALYRGIWEWGFLYKETEIPERERSKMKYATEPYKSPTVNFRREFCFLYFESFIFSMPVVFLLLRRNGFLN